MAHYYDSLGNLHATIERSDGKGWREVDLRDARKHSWKPSVSTVLKLLSAPALSDWQVKQGIQAALRLADSDHWNDIDFIFSESKQVSQRAAEAGTRIHEGISKRLQGLEWFTLDVQARTIVDGWWQWYEQQDELVLLQSELQFCNTEWGFGGTVDAVGSYKGQPCIVDFKTEDVEVESGFTYHDPEYPLQLAGYALGTEAIDALRISLRISRTTPRIVGLHLWQDNPRYLRSFVYLLAYWQEVKGYRCGKVIESAGKMFDFVGVK